MDFIARHKELFSKLTQDIIHFLAAAKEGQSISQINLQFEHLLAHAREIEENELTRQIQDLHADWVLFTQNLSSDELKKIQQKALRIKQELREL